MHRNIVYMCVTLVRTIDLSHPNVKGVSFSKLRCMFKQSFKAVYPLVYAELCVWFKKKCCWGLQVPYKCSLFVYYLTMVSIVL